MALLNRPVYIKEWEYPSAEAAAACVVQTHEHLAGFLRAGQTLAEIDAEVGAVLDRLDAPSCFKGYKIPGMKRAFPNHACLSPNACIVHGTSDMPEAEPLKPGDLISIDIGVKHMGWIGDAAWTYAIEGTSDENLKLMRSGVEATRRGVEAIAVGQPYETWANAVQSTCEGEFGFHSVAGLGGHGIGRRLHNPPFIANHLRPDEPWAERRDVWKPGLLVALEPMVAAGTSQRRDVPGDWPIFTADGSMSVHYEADVLVTADGPRNLTEGMFGLPEVVG